MADLRKAAEQALEDWLANDKGVVRFGMQLKPEWVSVASHGFISGYEAAFTQDIKFSETSPCQTEDENDICSFCNCWKKTREMCS
jgi:hypothetical protein